MRNRDYNIYTMRKSKYSRSFARAVLASAMLAPSSVLLSQEEDEVIELSPFEVDTTNDMG